jgi:hypothetical protein
MPLALGDEATVLHVWDLALSDCLIGRDTERYLAIVVVWNHLLGLLEKGCRHGAVHCLLRRLLHLPEMSYLLLHDILLMLEHILMHHRCPLLENRALIV